MKIKTVIIEDDPDAREVYRYLLKKYFSDEIEIVGEAESVSLGVKLIKTKKPIFALMDIEINGGTSFDILKKLYPYNFKIIFITAFNQFALKAIKFSAMDYILKPVEEDEFKNSIEKAIYSIESDQNNSLQNRHLMEFYKKENQLKKIVLKTMDAFHLVNISEIMYCRSDNSYTSFFIENGEEIVVSKGMHEYIGILDEYGFFRPHQSYLVNLNFIKKVDKTDGGFIIMKNGIEIPISSRQRKYFFKLMDNI